MRKQTINWLLFIIAIVLFIVFSVAAQLAFAHRGGDRSPQVQNTTVTGAETTPVSESGDYAAPDSPTLISMDATGGNRTVTLPDAATVSGVTYKVVKSDTSSNSVAVVAVGGDTIDGTASFQLFTQYETIVVTSNGINYTTAVPMSSDVDVRLFGVTGDGVTDDRAAIVLAMAQANNIGGSLIFPAGDYVISASLAFTSKVELLPGARLLPAAGAVLTYQDEFFAFNLEAFAGDGTTVFSSLSVPRVNVAWFAGAGEDFSNAIDEAMTAGVDIEAVIGPGAHELLSNVTIDESVTILPGAVLDPDAGVTIDIDAPINLPLQQVFDTSVDGTVIFRDGSVEHVIPLWFGVVGDGATDNSVAFTDAVDAANDEIKSLQLPAGVYNLLSNVDIQDVLLQMEAGAVIDIGGGATLTIGSGQVDAGPTQKFQGAGAVSFGEDATVRIMPQWWGALGDGSNDDSAAFISAIAAAAGRRIELIGTDSNYKLSANVTVPAGITVEFQQGALLSVDNTFTFTMNGHIDAGSYQIFSGAGSIAGSPLNDFVRPEWWGALHDGSTDASTAIQAAMDFACASNVGTVKFFGQYIIESALLLTTQEGFSLVGSPESAFNTSDIATEFVFNNIGTGTHALTLDNCNSWTIEGIRFFTTGTQAKSGLHLDGTTGINYGGRITDCVFRRFTDAGIFVTGGSGVFLVQVENTIMSVSQYGFFSTGAINSFMFEGGRAFNNSVAGMSFGAAQNITIDGIDLEDNPIGLHGSSASIHNGWAIRNCYFEEAIAYDSLIDIGNLRNSTIGPVYLAGTPANPDLILNNLCFNVTVINWPGDITIEGDFFQTDNIQIINCEGAITDNTGTVGAVSILSVDEPAVLGGLTIADRDSVGSTLVTNGIFDAANSVTGTHNGGDNSATALIDTTTNFVAAGVAVGESVYNTTDGSISTAITSITTTTNPNDTLNFVSFSCGTDDDFDDADSYEIVTGWRATQGATSEAGGQAGNAIQLVRLCGGLGGIRQEIAVVSGRIYEFTFYHKGTSTDSSPTFGQLALDSAAYETTSAADYAFWGTNQLANAAWTQYSTTFLAISDAVFINMLATYADPLYTLFDEVTLKEVTAGSLGVTGNLGVGTHSPAVKAHIQKQDTTNNAVVDIVRVDHLLESGTSAANGIGIGQVWHMPDAGGVEEQAAMDIFIEDITDGAEDVTIEWSVNSNGTLKPGIRIDGSGASIKIAIGAYGTPDAALAIPDNVKIAGAAPWFQIKETTGNTDFWFYVDPADGRLKVFNDNNATEVFTIQQDGDTKIAGDLVSNTYNFGADGEASDTYVITLDPAPAAYATGMMIVFTANTANTDGATLNVNALGAKTILKLHDEALETGDIEAGQVVVVVYDGTNMQMTSQLAQ